MMTVREALALLTPYDIDKPKQRFGAPLDGGYVLVDELEPSQTILSFGIGNQYEFDQQMAERGHRVLMFDHTIDGISGAHSKMEYYHQGVAGVTAAESDLFSIDDLLRAHKVEGNKLILKMDVEGAEFDAILATDSLDRFDQIVMEVHGLPRVIDEKFREIFCQFFTKLNNIFTLFHVHGNNFDGDKMYQVAEFQVPWLLEVSYIRTNLINRFESSTLYPTVLDRPNCGYPDKLLWVYPFVPGCAAQEDYDLSARYAAGPVAD